MDTDNVDSVGEKNHGLKRLRVQYGLRISMYFSLWCKNVEQIKLWIELLKSREHF